MEVPRSQILYFRRKIVAWSRANLASYPWRETTNPWLVLLSELLLQKTQARQVAAAFPQLAKAYPAPDRVAATPGPMRDAIALLGLRSRVDRITELAGILVSRYGGKVPESEQGLLALPGVGRYTAFAVLSFAFRKPVPVMDTNVLRVYGRFFNARSTKRNNPERDKAMWEFARTVLPRSTRAREFNQALLDFGASVCLPRTPACDACPLMRQCAHYLS